jgi:hypothetical protein
MSSTPRRLARVAAAIAGCLIIAACRPAAEEEVRLLEDTSPGVPQWDTAAPVVVPQGTVLRCAVAEDVAVRTARVGDVVTLIATEKVVLDGVAVVLPGTHLQARISRVRSGRSHLRAPELTLDTVSIESPQGVLRDCPARSIQVALESNDHGLAAGTILDVFVSAPIAMLQPEDSSL